MADDIPNIPRAQLMQAQLEQELIKIYSLHPGVYQLWNYVLIVAIRDCVRGNVKERAHARQWLFDAKTYCPGSVEWIADNLDLKSLPRIRQLVLEAIENNHNIEINQDRGIERKKKRTPLSKIINGERREYRM